MMRIPTKIRAPGITAPSAFWITLAHNDWILINGTTMGFYCIYAIVLDSWTARLCSFLDERVSK